MKILIASDSHQKSQVWMDALKKKYPDMDLYLHAGDLDDIPTNGWKVVAGNADRKANRKFPCQQIIEAGKHHILLVHGDLFEAKTRIDQLADLAQKEACDIVVFGYSHTPLQEKREGILFLNPGSLIRPRNKTATGFMILDTDTMKVNRIEATLGSNGIVVGPHSV